METRIETVFGAVDRFARESPDRIAVVSGDEVISYAQLAARVNAVAEGLRLRGIRAGEFVGVESGRGTENLVGIIGTMAFGAVPVSLPNEVYNYTEVMKDAEPKLVLATSDGMPEDAQGAAWNIDLICTRDLWERSAEPGDNHLERGVSGDDIAMLYYTSGTTSGVPKGVMQSYRMLHVTAGYITEIMRMDGSVREFVASPVDNAFWFGRCRCVLKVGGTLLLSKGALNPFHILSSLSRNEGNAISGDTPIFILFMHQMERHLRRVAPSLRWIKVASQAMPVDDKRRLMEMMPQARIVMNYGLTEAMRTTIHPFFDFPDKLESVGRPCPTVSLKIVDDEGRSLPPGETGEVLISGGNVASGYWRKPDLWAQRYTDGWYRSRDLGVLDEDGFLYLKGRIDHAINTGGKTIALNEVEERLRPTAQGQELRRMRHGRPQGNPRRRFRTLHRGRVAGREAVAGAADSPVRAHGSNPGPERGLLRGPAAAHRQRQDSAIRPPSEYSGRSLPAMLSRGQEGRYQRC